MKNSYSSLQTYKKASVFPIIIQNIYGFKLIIIIAQQGLTLTGVNQMSTLYSIRYWLSARCAMSLINKMLSSCKDIESSCGKTKFATVATTFTNF